MNDLKQQLINIGKTILQSSRNELYLSMRFLDIALSGLEYEMNLSTLYVGTDGNKILFNPRYLTQLYQNDTILVNRAYMHMLLHCVFRHMFHRNKREEDYWNLACDIAVESMIDQLQVPALHRTVSDTREEMYTLLGKKLKVFTAEGIYIQLLTMSVSELQLLKFRKEFWVDDHGFWQNEDEQQQNQQQNTPQQNTENIPEHSHQTNTMTKQQQQQLLEKWQDISEKMKTNLETFQKDMGQEAGELISYLKVENRQRYHYRRFLEKFVTLKEEIQLDEDAFDTIFYTYGLQMYGNMPLIEALEYKEVEKIEELVIAIDTSESCSDTIVKGFLEETYSILQNKESFFKKFQIHIIQCDCIVQSDTLITEQSQLKQYMQNFAVKGSGGTDFRPVFTYVDKLIEEKKFRHLKGLIYFTDGYGTFPKKRPQYDTAFVFMTNGDTTVTVPPWAMKVILTPDDIQMKEAKK